MNMRLIPPGQRLGLRSVLKYIVFLYFPQDVHLFKKQGESGSWGADS